MATSTCGKQSAAIAHRVSLPPSAHSGQQVDRFVCSGLHVLISGKQELIKCVERLSNSKLLRSGESWGTHTLPYIFCT